ncbi:MAG: xanthine dehydrogenase family protein subunit M [Anaerolineaceae bacterium]|nr:xanthine dehydrogenase family protein subunit M [Anaerolineaceae bacterium]
MFDCEVNVAKSCTELTQILIEPYARILAGGTDILPGMRKNVSAKPFTLIDVSQLTDLSYVREHEGQIDIGALTTHSKLITSPLLLRYAPALIDACASIGSSQTRNRGTLGGNLCNASPAADSVPPLLCLEAVVTLSSHDNQRQVPLSDFIIGPGRTCLKQGEYLDHITFAVPQKHTGTSFMKLGRRNGMSIAVVSTSVLLRLDQQGNIEYARVAFGSVAPTPICSHHAEAALTGKPPSAQLFSEAAQAMLTDINPIDDVRASREYRLHSAGVLLQRALQAAWQRLEMDN